MATTERKIIRSVRTSEKWWVKAQRRAKKEGTTMSNVVAELVEGYANGMFSLPRTEKVYDGTNKPL